MMALISYSITIFTSVCLQTATKKMAISNYTASNDHVPSPFIAAKHTHTSPYLITEARATHMPALMEPQLPRPTYPLAVFCH